MDGSYRVACLVSHPIQYQAPLFRYLAARPGIELTVFFLSDLSVHAYRDSGFGVDVKWDVPLLDGYRHEFLPRVGSGAGSRSGGRGRSDCALACGAGISTRCGFTAMRIADAWRESRRRSR